MSDMKFCRDCGAQIAKEAEICPKCGIRQMPPPKSAGGTTKQVIEGASDKSRLVVLLLCLFLGGLGVHCFYVGNKKRGIIMLVLDFTIIGIIVSLIMCLLDLIAILSGTFKDGDGNPVLNWSID